MFKSLLDFIFPRSCLGCGYWGEYLCSHCLNFLKIIDKPICPYCGQGAVYGQTHFSCRRKWGLDGLSAIFEYRGVVKQVIQQLKYDFNTDLRETILEMVLSFCGEDKALTKFTSQKNVCLVPVPLHWLRLNWRGFNQAEILGEMIAKKLGIGFLTDLLVRRKYTRPQSKLRKKKRVKNVRGAFKINHPACRSLASAGRQSLTINHQPPIIIFDDVWTTGSTIKECTQILKRNGFSKVWALSLARKL